MIPVRRSVVFGALVALTVVAAACGAGGGGSASSGSTTTAPTVVTTTTLPRTFGIPGTQPLGSLGILGSIQRVAVTPPANGVIAPPGQPVGAPPPATEKIAFRRFGSGPDLLLITGEHSTITSWDPQFLTSLARHFRVTVFDPPGVGYSAAALTVASVRSYADAAAGLSNALGLINPVAVGWGLGGGVAISLAERHPGLLTALVLVNSTVGAPNAKLTASAASVLGSAEVTPTVLSRLYFPPKDEADRGGWIERISDVSPDSIIASAVKTERAVEVRAESDHALVSGLKSLTLPVLVIASTVNAVSSPQIGRTIADEIPVPHATYDEITGGGYACFSTNGTAVVEAITPFVSSALPH